MGGEEPLKFEVFDKDLLGKDFEGIFELSVSDLRKDALQKRELDVKLLGKNKESDKDRGTLQITVEYVVTDKDELMKIADRYHAEKNEKSSLDALDRCNTEEATALMAERAREWAKDYASTLEAKAWLEKAARKKINGKTCEKAVLCLADFCENHEFNDKEALEAYLLLGDDNVEGMARAGALEYKVGQQRSGLERMKKAAEKGSFTAMKGLRPICKSTWCKDVDYKWLLGLLAEEAKKEKAPETERRWNYSLLLHEDYSDESKAKEHEIHLQLAEEGYVPAIDKMAFHFSHSHITAENPEEFVTTEQYRKDKAKAASYFEKSANAHDPKEYGADNNIANRYWWGGEAYSEAQMYEDAVRCFKLAGKAGLKGLGDAYRFGWSVERDPKKAMEYYEQCEKEGGDLMGAKATFGKNFW